MAALIRRATAWRHWHRWLGIIACTGLLLWSFSGLGHPIMVRLQPQAANFMPPTLTLGEQAAKLAAPADVLQQRNINAVKHLRLLNWDGDAVYQAIATDSDQVIYIDAFDGTRHSGNDADYAVWLARYYAGEHNAAVTSISPVTRFAGEYGPVNRLLPAYRVTFDRSDDLRVYVSTRTSRPGTLVDNNKAAFDWLFRHLHKWDWLKPVEPVRIAIALLFVTAAFVTAASGLYVYLLGWRSRSHSEKSLPVWHRRLSLVVALAILSFSFSGGYHLLKMWQRDFFAIPAQTTFQFAAATLTATPAEIASTGTWQDFTLVAVADKPYYRATASQRGGNSHGMQHDHSGQHGGSLIPASYHAADTGDVIAGIDELHAIELATKFSGLPAQQVSSVTAITRFGGEYGFVNKFLPVIRVEFDTPGQKRFYVEPASGKLAAEINDSDQLEGWAFAYLHKWNFLNGLGNDIRDGVMGLFALGHMIVAGLGIM
ncbi:MAG: PepSY domain-containing protein, partial [Gammaproteobacteria bacterium]